MARTFEGTLEGKLDCRGIRVALLVSRFNERVTDRLLAGAEECLADHGSRAEDRTVVHVPGSWELQFAAQALASTGEYDVIVALGTLIRGQTPHFDVLAQQVASGLGQVSLSSGVPVIFGVLTTNTEEQALERAGARSDNKGWEAALAAIEMASLKRQIE